MLGLCLGGAPTGTCKRLSMINWEIQRHSEESEPSRAVATTHRVHFFYRLRCRDRRPDSDWKQQGDMKRCTLLLTLHTMNWTVPIVQILEWNASLRSSTAIPHQIMRHALHGRQRVCTQHGATPAVEEPLIRHVLQSRHKADTLQC